MNFKIIYENDRIIAVDKSPGILVIPDQYSDKTDTLVGQLTAHLKKKAFVVHRIDRDTSGALLFAKDAAAHAYLCGQFEEGTVRKKYLTLVRGRMGDDAGKIVQPILIKGRKVSISTGGKYSVTEYKVLERFRNYTFLEVNPGTGRRHQIRIHLWHAGYPLAVDEEYTHTSALFLSQLKKDYKRSGKEKPLIGRLTLHSSSITFRDPASEKEMTVQAPLPDDFEVTLKQMRKFNT
jgi:23S rRNA pseudouridine1911/1915/1917 synthase